MSFRCAAAGSTAGNAAFGTAVEVDGVRLSTNASLGDPTGASTRNLSATNIESVEVVTGVPSAEYGDISSGVVKISTRKGKTPLYGDALHQSAHQTDRRLEGLRPGAEPRGAEQQRRVYAGHEEPHVALHLLFPHGAGAQLPEYLRQGSAFQFRRNGQYRRYEYRGRPRCPERRVGEGA